MCKYEFPVKVIQRILADENKKRIQSLQESNDRYYDFLISVGEDVAQRIGECETHTDIEIFISHYYRMTVQEWINSL